MPPPEKFSVTLISGPMTFKMSVSCGTGIMTNCDSNYVRSFRR